MDKRSRFITLDDGNSDSQVMFIGAVNVEDKD